MAEEVKVSAVEAEEPKTMAEKEEAVAENAGMPITEDGVYKLDLNKFNEENQQDAVQEQETEDGVLRGSGENEEAGQEAEVELQGVREEEEVETPVLEEVVEEETVKEEEAPVVEEPQQEVEEVQETQEPELNLPENIEDLVKFMNETGGTIEDYARLSTDYSNVDDDTLLIEYYKQTKPHLSYEEIQFLMEDEFDYDQEVDEPRFIKRKQLARKEAIAQAKNHLAGLKDQYYKEVKLGSKLLPEQQKAIDFFNRYNNEQKQAEELLSKQTNHFKSETNKVFNDEFKGFNFKVGDKKYRFNLNDVNKTKEASNITNVFDKYIDDNNLLTNAGDFHKALFAASNPDAIANHFYEQGKADAIKQMTADAKNIDMNPRKTADGVVDAGGVKVRAVGGTNSSGLKLKLKNY
jgi:hypothetical protein